MLNRVQWGEDTYRGGIRLNLRKLHGTFEQGARVFKDDQGLYTNGSSTGLRTSKYLGQQLMLNNGWDAYYIRGDGNFTKGYLTFSPVAWADIYGSIFHTAPRTRSNINEIIQGTGADLNQMTFYTGALDQLYGNAQMPRTSSMLSGEFRFFGHLRLREIYERDDYHNDSAGVTSTLFTLAAGGTLTDSSNLTNRLDVTTNRTTTELFIDVTKRLTLHGGIRWEWGRALTTAGLFNWSGPYENGELHMKIGMAGFEFRPFKSLSLLGDMETSDAKTTFYRTGLMNYIKVRAQARVTLPKSLYFTAGMHYLDNDNPAAGAGYQYTTAAETASLQWLPAAGKHVSIIAEYSHNDLKSNISYVTIFPYTQQQSHYRDNANTGSLMADFTFPGKGVITPKIGFGGSFVTTAGTTPSRYYLPQGRLLIPLTSRVHAYSEWQWYGLSQSLYMYEGFRAHTITTGLRFLL